MKPELHDVHLKGGGGGLEAVAERVLVMMEQNASPMHASPPNTEPTTAG